VRLWRERLLARQTGLAQLGFDEVFCRMWLLYLCYAEAGFRARYLEVSQLLLARELETAATGPDGAVSDRGGGVRDSGGAPSGDDEIRAA
jgi:hypothetical protein